MNVVTTKSTSLGAQRTAIPCPCCGHQIQAPSFEQIVHHYKIAPQAARLLDAVWKGRGLPVSTQRICEAIWRDDPNGGPPEARMYRNFQWALHHLRECLEGSGVAVENAGYNLGYRLTMGVARKES